MDRFEWSNAESVAQVIAQLGASPGPVAIKAGGVDLMDLLKERIIKPSRLVNLRTVAGLDRIVEDAQGLLLGPLVTLARIAADPNIRRRYRALADAAGHAATPQIRNMATVGGNLLQRPRCWYFRSEDFHCLKKGGTTCFAQEGENAYHAISGNSRCAIVHPSAMAAALMALGAQLQIAGAEGNRTVPVETFFIAPDEDVTREHRLGPREVIVGVRVPPASGVESAYTKQGQKESFDWPLAEVAVALRRDALGKVQQAGIVLGAFAPVPHRPRGAEQALVGKRVDVRTAEAVASAALDGVRPLAQNGYKVPLFRTLIRRTLLAAVRS